MMESSQFHVSILSQNRLTSLPPLFDIYKYIKAFKTNDPEIFGRCKLNFSRVQLLRYITDINILENEGTQTIADTKTVLSLEPGSHIRNLKGISEKDAENTIRLGKAVQEGWNHLISSAGQTNFPELNLSFPLGWDNIPEPDPKTVSGYQGEKYTSIDALWFDNHFICKMNGTILGKTYNDVDEPCSYYRRATAFTYWDKPHFYPNHTEIPGDMDCLTLNMFDDIGELPENPSNDSDLSKFILLAASYLEKFLRIHPFSDGNGRTGRLLVQRILWYICPFPVAFSQSSNTQHQGSNHSSHREFVDALVHYREADIGRMDKVRKNELIELIWKAVHSTLSSFQAYLQDSKKPTSIQKKVPQSPDVRARYQK